MCTNVIDKMKCIVLHGRLSFLSVLLCPHRQVLLHHQHGISCARQEDQM
jgi:hypothetical protein